METATNKNRTPSRCREWERNRRNKFNDAITRLGEVIKEINKSNEPTGKDAESMHYPKVEIVEKAIICLTDSAQEKTQLRAEILALRVKIESYENKNSDKKDACTQVFIGINKKKKDGKYLKVLMLRKPKQNPLKEKTVVTTNLSKVCNTNTVKESLQKVTPQKQPMLLPKSNLTDKKIKGPESTFVVLPATPYLFPQRPLLFPTVPPAFVLVDPSVQTLNKPSFPLVNRNNGDITKTTMVNILPISAYSRPLSATKVKSKKSNPKSKSDVAKKVIRKPKLSTKEPKNNVHVSEAKNADDAIKENKGNETNVVCVNVDTQTNIQHNSIKKSDMVPSKDDSPVKNNSNSTIIEKETNLPTDTTKSKSEDIVLKPKSTGQTKSTETIQIQKSSTVTEPIVSVQQTNNNEKNTVNIISKSNKDPCVKVTTSEEKDKENKLPNILDSALCENVVDGGNARLELAEEFLAASPTAAFLMSFPLVSGNRADSPSEEPQNSIQINSKDNNNQRRNEMPTQPIPYFEKPSEIKTKHTGKALAHSNNILHKPSDTQKYIDNTIVSKQSETKSSNTATTTTNVANENPFLNLPMSSLISTSCTLSDSTFGLDFDCNVSKSMPSQPTNYASNNNFFYKTDPFSTVKSTIYSTSSISSGHEFNSFGLYPCAMEKYTSKTKSDYPNVEDNLMKIGSSRLTYDIDLGWSHKGFDFVSSTTGSNTFNKDNILTTAAGPYSTSYNPFNPEFHVPLVTNSNKKDVSSSKPSSSFADTITSFYSQPPNLWSEDVPFYNNANIAKSLPSKHQNYLPVDNLHSNIKPNLLKQYDKQIPETSVNNVIKSTNIGVGQQHNVVDKYTKKSPNKMHINWMTSEIRPMQNNCNPTHTDIKEIPKPSYSQIDYSSKKQDHIESNYFPIAMHNFTSQTAHEELQVWPSTRPAGTTEISIEPPPINLPTLVGDLALGPHDKKKNTEMANRTVQQTDIQNCSNFFSVTQLMNRSSDNIIPSRYQGSNTEVPKSTQTKQNVTTDVNRKSRIESHVPQPCYVFNDSKALSSYENMSQYSQSKTKANKPEKTSKVQKNSYSAESLIRGGTCTQKLQDSNGTKFMMSQKYNDFNVPQNSGVAQVSHFPPILDYSDNSYTGQQFSGTNLYNSTTNTISNSFYSNFMPGSSNLMPSNYTSGPFSGDFIDYNQTTECNYTNHKYDELKIRNNSTMFQQDKVPSNYKSSRRESAAKHKLECSKKESSKKYQSKRAKQNPDIEEWSDTSHLLWQNKTPTKRHPNLVSDELPFPNYVGNQMATQYQPDFFNSHLMPSNMQSVGHNVDRSLTSFPGTSRANFNLSTIFPEITMKVQ